MHKLESMLKKMNLTVVLVYADWCGHCHTYKDTVWKQLEALKNKKVGLAKLNEKALADSPLSSAKINGYPSVLVVGKDGKPAEFKDESTGEPTNAMPNARDVEMMKGLVNGASKTPEPTNVSQYPKTIYIGNESNVSKKAEEEATPEIAEEVAPELEVESKSLLNASPADDLEPESESADVSAYNPNGANASANAANASANSANASANASNASVNASNASASNASVNASASANASPEDNASAILVDSESPVSSKVLPPSASDDLLDTNSVAVSGPENSSQLGGSLYMALLASARATAPAAILTAAATMKSRKNRKSVKRKTRGRK